MAVCEAEVSTLVTLRVRAAVVVASVFVLIKVSWLDRAVFVSSTFAFATSFVSICVCV